MVDYNKNNNLISIIIVVLILVAVVFILFFGFFLFFSGEHPVPEVLGEGVDVGLPVVEPGSVEKQGIFGKQ